MNTPRVEIMVKRQNWSFDGISVLIKIPQFPHRDTLEVVQGLQIVQKLPGELVEDSAILSDEAAQALLNQLWNLGYRPSDGTGSTGQLQATQAHLKDMRQIAFAKLNLKDAP